MHRRFQCSHWPTAISRPNTGRGSARTTSLKASTVRSKDVPWLWAPFPMETPHLWSSAPACAMSQALNRATKKCMNTKQQEATFSDSSTAWQLYFQLPIDTFAYKGWQFPLWRLLWEFTSSNSMNRPTNRNWQSSNPLINWNWWNSIDTEILRIESGFLFQLAKQAPKTPYKASILQFGREPYPLLQNAT